MQQRIKKMLENKKRNQQRESGDSKRLKSGAGDKHPHEEEEETVKPQSSLRMFRLSKLPSRPTASPRPQLLNRTSTPNRSSLLLSTTESNFRSSSGKTNSNQKSTTIGSSPTSSSCLLLSPVSKKPRKINTRL